MPKEINFRSNQEGKAYDKVVSINGQWRCDCYEFYQNRLTCRHIKTIIKEEMYLEDQKIEVPRLRATIEAAQLAFYGFVPHWNKSNSSPWANL